MYIVSYTDNTFGRIDRLFTDVIEASKCFKHIAEVGCSGVIMRYDPGNYFVDIRIDGQWDSKSVGEDGLKVMIDKFISNPSATLFQCRKTEVKEGV